MDIILGFDLREKTIKIMTADRTGVLGTEYLRFNGQIFSEEFFAEAHTLLRDFFNKKHLSNLPVYVVLPDDAVGMETFNLPNMGKMKLDLALETELINQFGAKYKEKKINKFTVTHNKQYVTVAAVYFDKTAADGINRMLTDLKLLPRQTTYCANALLDGVLGLMPKMRGKSFIFAKLYSKTTEIVVSSKGKTAGFAAIPHGADLLRRSVVEDEYMITEHMTGEIAVVNAHEAAKTEELTVADDAFGGFAADGAADAKFYRKMPRHYPKFMQRDLPQTPDGIAFGNFRIIAKWLLLYARQAELTDYMAAPEYILVDMPEDLRFVLDKMNEERPADGLMFKPYTAADKLDANLRENPELAGCLYAKQFNKNHNF